MRETLLLLGSGGQTYFPDSGPGNKTLKAGTATFGYFGEVTSTELFNGWEVAAAAGLEAGVEISTSATTWFKFIRNGRYLFIPITQLRTQIAWSELYAKGLVYGTREYGPYPFGGTNVSQLVVMSKVEGAKTWYLKPRLPLGANVDPSVTPITQANLDLSEFSNLLGRMTATGTGGITDRWETKTLAQLGQSSNLQSWVQETLSTNVNNAFLRGDTTGPNGQANNVKTTKTFPGGAWRPILELIPDSELKDPFQLTGTVIGPSNPAIQQSPLAPDSVLKLVNIQQVQWDYKQPVIVDVVASDSVFAARYVIGVTNQTINPIALTGTNIA